MMYIPKPIDTENVDFPPEIEEISELLAKNTHDIWAQQRMAEGWTYGARRDDAKKENPCLVPYEALPDSEKEYDRRTSRQTLKVLLALGYRLEKD